ncbi:MAG: DUF4301 family protein, partial [Paramuribaculum sp.]|nr:DUF4301 family protein [Paramuribaculum sp.]
MLSPEDLAYAEERGMDASQVEAQLSRFKTGFPYLKIKNAARQGQGIEVLSPEEEDRAICRWKEFLAAGGDVCKFVPASGAASRMFKALFEFVDGDAEVPAEGSDVARLIADIEKVAFYDDLNATTAALYGKSVADLKSEGRFKDLIAAIIKPEGMNYGGLPKGLLKFHRYETGSRTPIEEQLAEGAQTAANGAGEVKMHFTVSSNHRRLFEEKIAEVTPKMSTERGVSYHVSLSEQKPQTDTVAVNPDNTPFHEDGHLLFRPGGHGALIENLNDIDATVVFIKNIDNVVPDTLREPTVRYKQGLGGYMILLHDQIEAYLQQLATGDYN